MSVCVNAVCICQDAESYLLHQLMLEDVLAAVNLCLCWKWATVTLGSFMLFEVPAS